MNQLSYYVTKRLIVGSKDSSGTIIHIAEQTHSQRHQQQNEIKSIFWVDWMELCWLWDVFEKLSEAKGAGMEQIE